MKPHTTLFQVVGRQTWVCKGWGPTDCSSRKMCWSGRGPPMTQLLQTLCPLGELSMSADDMYWMTDSEVEAQRKQHTFYRSMFLWSCNFLGMALASHQFNVMYKWSGNWGRCLWSSWPVLLAPLLFGVPVQSHLWGEVSGQACVGHLVLQNVGSN